MPLEEVKTSELDRALSMMTYKIQDYDGNHIGSMLNKMISNSKYSLKGLELLSLYIEGLPAQFVLENSFHWLNICLVQHDPLKEIKLIIVGKNGL